MLFKAGEFCDVSSEWAISFTIWNNSTNKINDNFIFDIKETQNFEIKIIKEKIIYNINEHRLRDEIKINIKPNIDSISLKSALSIQESDRYGQNIKVPQNLIGSLLFSGNSVYENTSGVFLSSAFSKKGGSSALYITNDNFIKSTYGFSARKLIRSNWENQKDEYMTPNKSHPLWEQFQYDSLVYSLFNTSSNQSSLRQIKYKEKLWDIKNEFFWMSKSEMMDLAENKFFDDVYRDARSSDERYVYTLLHKEGLYEKLSPDAKEVLDMASDLVRLTFDMREILHTEHPEYHLNTWDAGWYQIKLILKAFYPEQLKEFTKKYKEFEDRMRPLVYELGFLRK